MRLTTLSATAIAVMFVGCGSDLSGPLIDNTNRVVTTAVQTTTQTLDSNIDPIDATDSNTSTTMSATTSDTSSDTTSSDVSQSNTTSTNNTTNDLTESNPDTSTSSNNNIDLTNSNSSVNTTSSDLTSSDTTVSTTNSSEPTDTNTQVTNTSTQSQVDTETNADVAPPSNEYYTLHSEHTQHRLFAINNCGQMPNDRNDQYVLADGVSNNSIFNSWNHITGTTGAWSGISKPANTYEISDSYTSTNTECNGVASINNTLVKRYGNWDQQHANGFKFKLNNAPKFSEIEYLVFDLYVDSAASTLPTKSEIADKFTNLSPSSLSLTQAELDQFDDGLYQIDIQLNVDLPNPTFSDPNYETEGDVHGTINLQVAREDADQWLRVEVPVKEMIFREEAPNWAIDTISYNDAKDLKPSDVSFMAETTSRKVYRHYKNEDPSFNEFAIPELFKEQAIRLRYVGIGADPVDEFFAAVTDPIADFSISRTGTVVNLDAAATKLGSAEEHSYSWSVSNGDVAEGKKVTFDLAVSGSYDITLTVKDLVNSNEHSVTQTVLIEDAGTGDCSQGGLNFCADFESGLPTSDLNKNAGTYEVDNSIGYNSSSSVKVSTKFYSNGGFFEVTPPAADFWTRVFIRSSGDSSDKAPGGDEQGFARPHGVILKAVDGNAQLRVGDHRCQLEINRDGGAGHLGDDLEMTSGSYGDDATVCEKDFGARMQPNTWYCMEVHFNGPESELQVFWDNQNVQQLHVTEERTWTNEDKPPGGQWSKDADKPWGPYNFDTFAFGYESFNNGSHAPNIDFWFDNVATSTSRIGCGDYQINAPLHESTKLQPTSNGYPYADEATSPVDTGNGSTDTSTDTGTDGDGDGDAVDSGADKGYIYDNFEGQAAGTQPEGWSSFLNYSVDNNNTSSSGSYALIDDSKAHSGSNSVHILTGDQAVLPSFIFRELPKDRDAYYTRAWMYLPVELGGGVKGGDGNHVHFLAYSTEMSGSNKEELRFGTIQDGILGAFFPKVIDGGSENIVPKDVIPANEWVCIEFGMKRNPGLDFVYGYINGKAILEIESVSDWVRDPGNFLSSASDDIENFISLGWRAFGDNKGVKDVWFDDVVVADEYIGCD